jgi:hypothetical protein
MNSSEVESTETLSNEEMKIASELIKEIIEKASESLFEISKFEFALKYDPSINPEEPYMKRKLSQIRNEILNSFGSSSLELKRTYSKIEQEKIELKNKLDSEVKSKDEQEKKHNTCNLNNSTYDFMSDAKRHKSKLEKERDYALQVQNMIGKKRKSNGEVEDINNIDTKLSQCQNLDDWNTLMGNSIKKKSKLEIEKEIFLEETKKRKEQQLKNITTLSKSQVFKFDESIMDKKTTEKIQIEESKLQQPVSTPKERFCQVCKISIEQNANCKRISNKCEHYLHYVNL